MSKEFDKLMKALEKRYCPAVMKVLREKYGSQTEGVLTTADQLTKGDVFIKLNGLKKVELWRYCGEGCYSSALSEQPETGRLSWTNEPVILISSLGEINLNPPEGPGAFLGIISGFRIWSYPSLIEIEGKEEIKTYKIKL